MSGSSSSDRRPESNGSEGERPERTPSDASAQGVSIRSVPEGLPAGVFRAGPTGRIEYANEALAEMLGVENEEELIGQDLTTFYADPADRGRMLAEEGASGAEVRLRAEDGSPMVGLLSAEAHYDRRGRPVHFDGVITDITERKREEARSRLQSQVLRQVAEGEPLPEILAALIEGIEALRPGMIGSVLLYDRAENRIQHGAAPSLPEGYNEALDGLQTGPKVGSCGTAMHEGAPVITEDIEEDPRWEGYRDLARGHGLRACWSVPIRGEEGEVLGTFAMYYREPRGPTDADRALIEEGRSLARLAIERHRESRRLRLLSAAIGQAKEAVVVTEAEPIEEPGPQVVYANAAFEEMTGYSEEEILGKTPRILQGPETDREVLDSLKEALRAGESWQGETVNYRRGGEPYRVQWNVSPVRGAEGEIEHWVSVQRDVTEERTREETLRRQKHLLEQTQRLAGAWEVDLRSGEMSWSDKVYEIHEVEPGTEVSVEEGIGFYAPEARPEVREAFERCAEEGESYDLEVPLVTAKGNRRWVRTVGGPAETDGEWGMVSRYGLPNIVGLDSFLVCPLICPRRWPP